ncbi:carboxylating nicotinate-nucleotide diphosphorylase [Patescibacteria group bacterium]|nr:carboxylating nicotinate-nucleotide diphosphorylase [Patescibacteria group bacterium]MBU1683444.1 carboxylating nicotinate-nucleotide diphosphorylase [Patescibacteria group bacterium]MBU1934990.1 carboxylating nicotinate-nucleotide diphosphorylase [Patescibacteria group bacterium]
MSFLNAVGELSLKNPVYKKAVQLYVWQAYLEDLGKGDVTTNLFIKNKSKKVIAEVVMNKEGILAGIHEAEWFLNRLGIKVLEKFKEGTDIKRGDIVLKIEGTIQKILSAERTLLNLLQRMSGVATASKKLSSKLPKTIKLLATRKTLWGLLDKKAVALGGGATHRLNLDDAVLIKDNHLDFEMDWGSGLSKVLKNKKVRFVEIELESIDQIHDFLVVYDSLKEKVTPQKPVVVMLDNFRPADIKRVIPQLKQAGLTIELSGGISERNIEKYCIKGVTAISSGAITGRAKNLDMSLNIKETGHRTQKTAESCFLDPVS